MSSFPPYKDDEDEEAANEPFLPEPAPLANGKPRGYRSLHVKLYIIVFLVNIAFTILSIAQTRIYERIFCHQWFDDHDPTKIPANGHVPEELCKIPQVQTQISSLRGWMEFFEAAPTLIMAIPIGIFADLYGRQLFVRLELTVIVVQQIWITIVTYFPHQIPIHAVWLEGLLNFISGGKMVADMLFACVITDITPPEELATAFFRYTAIASVTRVLGPAIAGALMKINAWYAVLVGIVGLMIMTAIVFTIPETLKKKHEYIEIAPDEDELPTRQTTLQTTKTTVIKAFKELGLVWTDWRLCFLGPPVPIPNARRSIERSPNAICLEPLRMDIWRRCISVLHHRHRCDYCTFLRPTLAVKLPRQTLRLQCTKEECCAITHEPICYHSCIRCRGSCS